MHRDSLELDQVEISAQYLPDKYFKMVGEGLLVQTVVVDPSNPSVLFVGSRNGLYRSQDKGKSWANLHQGLGNSDIRDIVISPRQSKIVYVATAKGIFLSENGGNDWTEWFEESAGLANVDIRDLAMDPENPEVLYAATAGGVFKSEDEGDIWTDIFTPIIRPLESEFRPEDKNAQFIRLSSQSASLYIETSQGIYKSEDQGASWKKKWEDVLPSPAKDLASLDTDPEFLYHASNAGLHKSFNRGITWIKDPVLSGIPVESIFINPFKTTQVYVTTTSGIQVSQDGGDSWTAISFEGADESSIEFSNVSFLKPGKSPLLFIATHTDFLISDDGGKTWAKSGLAGLLTEKSGGHMRMDLVKLLTEIHTGRFFGDLIFVLVDVATFGLVFLVFSGIAISVYRHRIAKSNSLKQRLQQEEVPVDAILEIQETAEGLSSESHQIHDMIEHINSHLARCKTVYLSKEKQEIEKIGAHINDIDKKMHHLMERIEEFDKLSQTDDAR